MPAASGATASLTISAAELRTSFPGRLRDGELGVLAERPLLVVVLDDGPDVGEVTRHLPCVVVGVAYGHLPSQPWTSADILLTDMTSPPAPWTGGATGWLERLESACTSSPLAAVALTQLLRFSPALSVIDGLVAESFAYSMLQGGPEHQRWLATRPRRATPPTEHPVVLTTRAGPVLSITLNRPERHNAFSAAMRDGLAAALQLADADRSIERIDLSGSGASFCSGGDLDEFGTFRDPATAHAVRVASGAGIWMDRCARRSRVRVHGACIGAGVELASFAANVTAAPDTGFQLPEVAMGLVPGAGGTVSIPRRIGGQRTALLGITGASVDAATALDWGLIDEIATSGSLPPLPGG